MYCLDYLDYVHNLSNNLSNNLTNEKHIIKFIDDIINCKSNNHSKNDKDNKDNKDKCIIFYNKLIKNQPQLHNEFSSIKEHITYFMDQDILERDNILSNLEKVYEITDNKIPRFFKIINSNLDAYHKKLALRYWQKLYCKHIFKKYICGIYKSII